MDSEKASDIANSFCEKWSEMAPSARWLNLTRLIESYAESRVREAILFERTEAGLTINWKHGFDSGYKAGQEAMRERAAMWLEQRDILRAAQILSLSIEEKA